MRFAGKVAVVTGSSRGIGRGIAARLAAEGASVVIHGLHSDTVDRAERELQSDGHRVKAIACDVSNGPGADRLFEAAVEAFGTLDILVNNAAWANPEAHILEMSEAHWDSVVETNLKSVFLCSGRAARAMVAAGKGGSIVSIGSYSAQRAHRMMAAYDAVKGAVEAFSRAIALDLAPFGIRANVVAPGPIATDAFNAADPSVRDNRVKSVPVGRVGSVQDVAGAVAYLASDEAGFITGQVIYVDGGVLAQLRPPQIDVPLPSTLVLKERAAQ